MKINREGYRIIVITFVLAALIAAAGIVFLPCWTAWILGGMMLGKVAFVLFFFRDPRREVLLDENVVYAPADGEIVVVEPVTEGEYLGEKCLQVSVFMSIWNVHANWFPVGGRVVYFRHHPGKYLVAWHPKSSTDNERTTTVVDTGRHKVLFRQIAGFVARRIVSYAVEGADVGQNSRCGFIKFGSRVDVMLPLDSEVLVLIGDKVKGAQTPIARLSK